MTHYTYAMISTQVIFVITLLLPFRQLMSCFPGPDYPPCWPTSPLPGEPVCGDDVDNLQLAQNVEHLEADYFLWGRLGFGLDEIAPWLVMGGPPPIGVRKANLDYLTEAIITEMAYQEVGHLRALKSIVGGIPRPFMDLSASSFANFFDEAFVFTLDPPFDPYRDSLSCILSVYMLPYVGLTAYTSANPFLCGCRSKKGLLSAESGQDAIIRSHLYERAKCIVDPYNYTVPQFTIRLSKLRNRLGMCGIKDEGLFVPIYLGAENRTYSNILSLNFESLSYPRSPQEVLRILYQTGNEHIPGGFYPHGGNRRIARQLLPKS